MESKVYLPSDIQAALGIGRTHTYAFLNEVYKQKNPPFKVIKIGSSVRVPREPFDEWLKQMK